MFITFYALYHFVGIREGHGLMHDCKFWQRAVQICNIWLVYHNDQFYEMIKNIEWKNRDYIKQCKS